MRVIVIDCRTDRENYSKFQVKLTPEELKAIIEQTGGALKVSLMLSTFIKLLLNVHISVL